MPAKQKIALLTAGGLAPCLSAAVGCLIERYSEIAPDLEIIAYRSGYTGLLKGDILPVTPQVRANARALLHHGGSPIGNSRVKLTNAADCEKRGLVKPGESPLDAAARQLEALIHVKSVYLRGDRRLLDREGLSCNRRGCDDRVARGSRIQVHALHGHESLTGRGGRRRRWQGVDRDGLHHASLGSVFGLDR